MNFCKQSSKMQKFSPESAELYRLTESISIIVFLSAQKLIIRTVNSGM